VYSEHERYGPQLEVERIRPISDTDRADGFDPLEFVAGSRFDPDKMLAELRGVAEAEIADAPFRQLVVGWSREPMPLRVLWLRGIESAKTAAPPKGLAHGAPPFSPSLPLAYSRISTEPLVRSL
jgi:hypothetical protein